MVHIGIYLGPELRYAFLFPADAWNSALELGARPQCGNLVPKPRHNAMCCCVISPVISSYYTL
jgi:hypothetical protein